MKTRAMLAKDLEAVAKLCGQLVEGDRSPEELAARFARTAQDPRHFMIVAVDEGDAPVGWAHIHETFLFISEPCMQVFALVVDEASRGKGVGKFMMDRVEEMARERGLSRVYLRSQAKREQAHAFYERLGYVKIKTQYAFEKKL